MKNSSKKENHPESSVLSEEQEMVEVKAIKEKLSEMHSDIKKN